MTNTAESFQIELNELFNLLDLAAEESPRLNNPVNYIKKQLAAMSKALTENDFTVDTKQKLNIAPVVLQSFTDNSHQSLVKSLLETNQKFQDLEIKVLSRDEATKFLNKFGRK